MRTQLMVQQGREKMALWPGISKSVPTALAISVAFSKFPIFSLLLAIKCRKKQF